MQIKRNFKWMLSTCVAASVVILFSCSHEGHNHHEHDRHDEHDEMAEHNDHDEHESHDEHEHQEGKTATTFHLENDDIARLKVEVAEVQPAEFASAVKVYGEILPSATDVAQISAPTAGVVRFVGNINRGASVGAGSAIAAIDQTSTTGATGERAAAANVASTKREYERLKRLKDEGLVTMAELNAARAAYEEAVAAHSPAASAGAVSSPVAGVITDLYVTNGQYVEPGQPIATVTRSGKMSLRIDLPERYAAIVGNISGINLRIAGSDDAVTVTPSAAPRQLIADNRGYIPLLFSFDNPGIGRTGIYTDAYLLGENRGDIISVPREAIIEDQGSFFVYVAADIHDDGIQFERRVVTPGTFDGKRYAILSGLNAGEKVATAGASMLRMAQAQSTPAEGHHHH